MRKGLRSFSSLAADPYLPREGKPRANPDHLGEMADGWGELPSTPAYTALGEGIEVDMSVPGTGADLTSRRL